MQLNQKKVKIGKIYQGHLVLTSKLTVSSDVLASTQGNIMSSGNEVATHALK